MPRVKKEYQHHVWTPGLVSNKAASAMAPGEAVIAKNVDLTTPGVVRRRLGWFDVEPDFSAGSFAWKDIFGLYQFDLPVGERTALPGPPSTNYNSILAVVGPELWHSDPALADGEPPTVGDDWFKLGTLSLRASDSFPLNVDTVRPMFVTLNNKVYIAKSYGGVGGYTGGSIAGRIDSWDSVTFTAAVSGAPEASILVRYRGNLVAAGINLDDSKIQWSGTAGITGPDTWPANNTAQIGKGDGDQILGLGAVHNMLLVLKRNSVWRLTGTLPDDGTLDDASVSVVELGGMKKGCVSPRSVVSTGSAILWLGESGVYSYDGQSIREVTEAVRNRFIGFVGDEQGLTGSGLEAVAYYDPRRDTYTVSMPAVAPGTFKALEIGLRDGHITEWEGSLSDATSFVRFKDKDWVGFPDGSIGHRDGALTDDGTAVAWDYMTGRLPLAPENEKKMTRLARVLTNETTEGITVQAVADFNTADTKGKDTPDFTNPLADPSIINRHANLSNVGNDLQLKVSGDGSDTTKQPEVYSVTVEYTTLSHA